jgi:hypothetical protein
LSLAGYEGIEKVTGYRRLVDIAFFLFIKEESVRHIGIGYDDKCQFIFENFNDKGRRTFPSTVTPGDF